MRRKLTVLSLGAFLIAICAMTLALLKTSDSVLEKKTTLPRNLKGKPLALSKHLERLQLAIPGNGGESDKGPGGAAQQKLFALAYPDTDIPLKRASGARSSFLVVKSRDLPTNGPPGSWQSIGPSNAVYPFFEFRDTTVYVPNEYVAAGRTTTIAIAPNCTASNCRVWIGASGGGIWRTDKALSASPSWVYLSGPFEINSIGSIALDPNDATGNTIWIGTGEANASADSVYGVGLYKSTNGGNTWTGPLGKSVFNGRAVGAIAIKPGNPNTIYAGSTRAVNGFSSVIGGGVTISIPGAAIWGLYKSTDGGTSWNLIHNGATTTAGCTVPATVAGNGTPCSPRGVRNVKIDPADANTIYASSYARGVWRSNNEGATWTQIKQPLNATLTTDRAEIAITLLPNNDTRMYVGHGHTAAGGQYSRLFRSDNVRTGSPVFVDLTSSNQANPGYGSFDYCTGQCWYDNLVYTPPGQPDIVYLGGSNQYGETGGSNWVSNGRGLVLSTDAGVSWTDVTYDATDFAHPNGIHPDHHAIVTNPNNPFQFIEAGDGGVIRSSGQLTDISSQCADRGIGGATLARCQQLLSAVPTKLESINKGLSTLQFQSVSVNPFDVGDVQGGTQDNGTFESYGNLVTWNNTMIGDGGQSGFDINNPGFRFHTFFLGQVDANFSNGDVADWNWISDPFWVPPFFEGNAASFYIPIVHDPSVAETIYAGLLHVWRTKTYGRGSMSIADLRQHCNEWTGDFPVNVTCGDWEPLGSPGQTGQLTSANYGDRAGVFVAAVERAPGDSSTLWAATATGRVFVSKNADQEPANFVTFTRIDTLSTNDPGRFVSGIFVDPADPNHAWISYTGFSAATPGTPGHIFEVTYDPNGGTATWTSLDGTGSGSLGDIPLSDVVYDNVTGDLYVSCDFAVFREASGGGISWTLAASGMPSVEVAQLNIVSSARKLFAATHGLSAWSLNLP